jgi:hypothetical protein
MGIASPGKYPTPAAIIRLITVLCIFIYTNLDE